MKKLSKSALALFLAGAMAFMPAADILAADNTDNIAVTSTQDIVQESITEETDSSIAETGTDAAEEKEDNKDAESNDSNDNEAAPDTENEVGGGDNTDSESGDTKDDNETGPESGSGDNTGSDNADNSNSENISDSDLENGNDPDSENNENPDSDAETDADTDLEDDNADVQDSDEENTPESDDLDSEEKEDGQAADTETEEFPGFTNSALSAKQLSDKKALVDHLDEITTGNEGTDYVAGELMFSASTLAEAEKIAAAYGAELKDFDEGIGVLMLPETVSVSHALTVAAKSKDVVLPPAWPNYIYWATSDTAESVTGDTTAVSDEVYSSESTYTEAVKAYSDPFLAPGNENYQYQHAMVGSTYAWNAGYTGAGIKIAILDSGVSAHPDLKIVYNENFAVENINGSENGISVPNIADSADTDDKNGHGTHVAGLAAAESNLVGGAGIAPEAEIYNIRVLNAEGAGTAAGIIRGVNKAVEKKVDIINMSLGGPGYAEPYNAAIDAAYNAGIAVFAAAGNDGSKVKSYPACYKNAVCVGAVDANKGRTYFSNYGSWIELSAPGMSLVSTSISESKYSFKVGGEIYYEEMSGTSQATPIVSGTAAVILSADDSIRSKTGKAKVDALISKMKKGKMAGKGGAAGIVSLAKALDIPVSTAAPKAPVFEQTNKTVSSASLTISIKAALPTDVIYYNVEGKNPTYKNGVLSNATLYTAPVTIGGSAKITVKAIAVSACGLTSKAASITYTFKPQVSAVNITGQRGLLKGKSTTLKAAVEPSYAANKKVTWTSSAPSEVSVSASGKVTATNSAVVGKVYTITATSADAGKAAGTFQITVKDKAKIGSVAFKKDGKAIKKDTISNAIKGYDLASLLEVTDTSKKKIEDPLKEVDFFSSNTQVAVIVDIDKSDTTKTDNIKINGVGKAVITAVANDGSGKKATFTLTVGKKITTLTLSGSSKIVQGKSTKLTATVNSDASDKKLDWTVSPADTGVTVKNGTVKASKTATAGSYTVTASAKDGSKTASKVINVIAASDVKVTKIQLKESGAAGTAAFKSGTIFRVAGNHNARTSIKIEAAITGGTGSDVEFASSNPEVADVIEQDGNTATVTATGKITGTTKITCKSANGKSASCTIKVVNPPSNIMITSPAGFSEYFAKGKKMKLSAVFEEEFGAVSSKKATWESSDKTVATVDKNGTVKGVAVGSATIKAVANDGSGASALYYISVLNPIKTLGFYKWGSSSSLIKVINQLPVGSTTPLIILYNGKAFSTDSMVCPDVAIEIGNPDIAYVQYVGAGAYILYGLKTGSTTITVKALDGTGVKKSYNFQVISK